MSTMKLHQELADKAYELACQKVNEEGDVDIDYNYVIMEMWVEEYYKELCKEEGIEPSPEYLS